ncbi:gene transfer agent family protein [Chelatococcus sp. GCM10030263]|uniref:gene transfer agent family protein n=1 Tax=Chelatococcus sp. GCM10030263 TaxID=3273387 RepID=UPI003606A8CD
MANRHRGEVEAVFADRRYTLCLTLGALAELETALGADGLAGLGARLGAGLSARDVISILAAGLRGGGTAVSDEEVAQFPLADFATYAEAVRALLAATFGESGASESEANP